MQSSSSIRHQPTPLILTMAAIKITFFVLALLMATAATAPASVPLQNNETRLSSELAQNNTKLRVWMTCDRFPRVCRAIGSPGPDCCRRRCVDVDTDTRNCGECGRRCRYGEVCCRGKCVDVLFDPMNCGWCKNKCKKGGYCAYGMCNYA